MNPKSLRLAGTLSATLLLAATLEAAPVRVEGGLVSGVVADGVVAYKGIPYAAPPVGDLRWRAPQAVTPWTGVRAADHGCCDSHGRTPSDLLTTGSPPAPASAGVAVVRAEPVVRPDSHPHGSVLSSPSPPFAILRI